MNSKVQQHNSYRAPWHHCFTGHSNGLTAAPPLPPRHTTAPAYAFAHLQRQLKQGTSGLVFAMLALFAGTPAVAETTETPLPYQLGQGVYYPQQRLRIGGYTSIHYTNLENQQAAFSVKDLSLFLTKELSPRWLFFSEMEIGDAFTVTARNASSRDAEFDVERLYLDYRAHQAATLRFGKFLTPVGQWNLVHADPLVWTVSRPLTTTAAFSRHSTGVMAYGSIHAGANDLDYWLFSENSEQLDPARDEEFAFMVDGASLSLRNNFQHASGARAQLQLFDAGLSLGTSYLNFELEQPHHRYQLNGVDFSWSTHFAELTGEAIFRRAEGDTAPDEQGGFLQAVVPLPRNFYLVGRWERYQASILANDIKLNTVGFNYRPNPAMAFKFEYSSGTDNELVAPDGWLASFGVLF